MKVNYVTPFQIIKPVGILGEVTMFNLREDTRDS